MSKHALFAAYDMPNERRRVRVSDWMEWGEAIDLHAKREYPRQDDEARFWVNGYKVRYFAVRSDDDPQWSDLPFGEVFGGKPRKLAGVPLYKVAEGSYVTPDGAYEIVSGKGFTFCENAHPVKITPEMRAYVWESIEKHNYSIHGPVGIFGYDLVEAVRDGKRGYLCQGGEEHEGPVEYKAVEVAGNWEGEWTTNPTDAARYLAAKIS